MIIPNDLSLPTVATIVLFCFQHHVSRKDMETSIETLLVADTLLSTSREDDTCMVFPHPPSLPQQSPAPPPASSMSPHSIAQSTMSELSQLDYDLMYQDYPPPRYHHTYQELESSCNSHWREPPASSPSAPQHSTCQTR